MGAGGNCYDNIYTERVIGILKGEYGLDSPFVNLNQVNSIVEEADIIQIDLIYRWEWQHLRMYIMEMSLMFLQLISLWLSNASPITY
jgi:transposase InsO family protein